MGWFRRSRPLLVAFAAGLLISGCSLISPTPGSTPEGEAPSTVIGTPTVQNEGAGTDEVWVTYTDARYGFQFEYPAIFDQHEGCELTSGPDPSGEYDLLLTVGSRITLGYQVHPDHSLDQAISSLTEGAQDVEVVPTPIADTDGKFVSYRFGGTGRLGLAYFVERSGNRATISLTPPWRCDFVDQGVSEGSAFEHIAATFRFGGE